MPLAVLEAGNSKVVLIVERSDKRGEIPMGNLRDQMKALAQGITTSAHEREIVVSDSKAQTARMLQAFGLERMAMAKDSKSGFAADRAVRSVDVRAMLANTNAMCEGYRQDHVRMGRSLRRKLVETTEEVASFVASLRAAFAKAHHHMTKTQRAGLAKDRRDRSREVAELMDDFHVSRGEMAQELAENLAKFTQEIKSQVSGLNGFRASLQKIHEDARSPRQIPNSLLGARACGAAPAPSAALSREPEARQKRTGKKKTTVAKAGPRYRQKAGKTEEKVMSIRSGRDEPS